ncbi:MAG: sigma-70 family RNA polymerase sigma factor [Verrucomicrobia bacterium]|nr:sigma-70 family RNA polymerase sigma factor [Verrucomicrobiota bacterium]
MSTEFNRSFCCAVDDIKNLLFLGQRLSQPQDEVSKYLTGGFSEATRQSLSSWLAHHQDGDRPVAEAVVQEFNGVVQGPPIYGEQRFARVTLSNSASVLRTRFRAKRNWRDNDAPHFNQALIKDAYPVEIWRIWVSDIEALKNPEDEDAWKEAYEILWPVANRAAGGSDFSDTDIQEIASEAIQTIRRILIENQKPIESGKALISLTAWRSCWDARNKAQKRGSLKEVEGVEEVSKGEKDQTGYSSQARADDATILPDELLSRVEDVEFIRRSLARLDDRQRALLWAREIDEKSYEELQTQFNLSSDQVGVYLKRAREKLKLLFEEESEKPL